MWHVLLRSRQPYDFSVQSPSHTFHTQTTDTDSATQRATVPSPSDNMGHNPPEQKSESKPDQKWNDRTTTALSQSSIQPPSTHSDQRLGNGGTVGTDATLSLATKSRATPSHASSGSTSSDGLPITTTFIDGKAVLMFDEHIDQYFNPNLFLLVSPESVCYICCEPCLKNQALLSTACTCKGIIHQECFSELVEYGSNFKMNPENRSFSDTVEFGRHHLDRLMLGGELPKITRFCGTCKGACLGNFHDQFDFTSLALRRFNRLTLAKREVRWSIDLPPIIYSFEQIIKSIRRDWRSNVSKNIVLSELVASLSLCYTIVGRFSAQTEDRDLATNNGLCSAIIAMATCDDDSINMGVSSMPFIMDVLIKPFGAATISRGIGRIFVPVIVTYLLNLVLNTTDEVAVGERTGDNDDHNRVRRQDIAHKHRLAQKYLVDIMNSNIQKVDKTLFKWCIDTLYNFMTWHARFVTGEKDDDAIMGGVPQEPDKNVVYTDKNVIYLSDPMFKYLFDNFDHPDQTHGYELAHIIWYHEKNNKQRDDERIIFLNKKVPTMTGMARHTEALEFGPWVPKDPVDLSGK